MNYNQFFESSPAYKDILAYTTNLPMYRTKDKEHITSCIKVVLETIIIYKDDLYNEKFYAASTESLLSSQHSQEARDFVANHKPDLFYIKNAVFQFFVNSEKGFEVILDDIAAYMPQEKLHIDFNNNFKNFAMQSDIMPYVKKSILNDGTLSIYHEQTEMVNSIADLVCEMVVLHIDDIQASEFKKESVKNYINPCISQHLQDYFEKQDEMTFLLANMAKLAALKALMEKDSNGSSYIMKLKQEMNSYHEYMVLQEMLPVPSKKVKHNKL